jgi:hypothetical protein
VTVKEAATAKTGMQTQRGENYSVSYTLPQVETGLLLIPIST